MVQKARPPYARRPKKQLPAPPPDFWLGQESDDQPSGVQIQASASCDDLPKQIPSTLARRQWADSLKATPSLVERALSWRLVLCEIGSAQEIASAQLLLPAKVGAYVGSVAGEAQMNDAQPSDTQRNHTQRTGQWLLRTVIAASFAVIGFFGRDQYEEWKKKQEAAIARLDSLKELSVLLDESYSIFRSQNDQAQRLQGVLQQNHPKQIPKELGYDETFFMMFDRFTADEAELQKLIRSTTINSQRRVNQDMRVWLQRAHAFKRADQPNPQRVRLSEELRALELHLNQWHDKYEAWIPADPKRSLVYLRDEKGHGSGFPEGLKKAVDDVIASWR